MWMRGVPGRRQPRFRDGLEIPAEPGEPTAIPHLEGKRAESSLEESRGNRVYTRRRGVAAREEVPWKEWHSDEGTSGWNRAA